MSHPSSEQAAEEDRECPQARTTLDRVPLGATIRVTDLSLEGLLRRRLLDLGFVLGARVRPIRRSPLGDPTAYEVMGAVVALRRTEAACIGVVYPDS